MNIKRSDGKGIPFAADIHDETNAIIGNVGQGGQAFVRGIQQQGTVKSRLEASMPKTCIAQYQQPNVTSEKIQQTIILNNILCQLNNTKRDDNDKNTRYKIVLGRHFYCPAHWHKILMLILLPQSKARHVISLWKDTRHR